MPHLKSHLLRQSQSLNCWARPKAITKNELGEGLKRKLLNFTQNELPKTKTIGSYTSYTYGLPYGTRRIPSRRITQSLRIFSRGKQLGTFIFYSRPFWQKSSSLTYCYFFSEYKSSFKGSSFPRLPSSVALIRRRRGSFLYRSLP